MLHSKPRKPARSLKYTYCTSVHVAEKWGTGRNTWEWRRKRANMHITNQFTQEAGWQTTQNEQKMQIGCKIDIKTEYCDRIYKMDIA